MQESKLNNKKIIALCYVILFILLELFHSFIGMYFDDYGNASLSYGYDAGVDGMNWTLQDLGSWAHWIYFNFSGRILCGSLLNLLIKLGHGPHLFMAIQAGIVTLLFFVMYRLIMYFTAQKRNLVVVILSVALFFQMPSDMFRWNLCWASASVLYIWPLLAFFTAIYLQILLDTKPELKKRMRIVYTVTAVFCILIAAFSHEQTGLSIAVYLVAYVISERIYQKRFAIQNIVFAVIGVCTYAALFLAPGNWNRLDGNTDFAKLSLFGKIAHNFQPLMECLFCLSFDFLYLLITLGLVYAGYRKYKQEQKKLPLVMASVATACLVVVIGTVYLKVAVVALIFETIYLLAIFVTLLLYNYDQKHYNMNVLLIASAASAFCVLISPTLPMRCFTEWILVIHMLLLVVACDLWYAYIKETFRIGRVLYYVLFLLICVTSAKTFATLSFGYLGNKDALEKNDAALRSYTEKDGDHIILNKLVNGFFAPAMPYDDNYEYISYWMKQYYNIPDHVALVWSKDNMISLKKTGEFYKDGWFGKTGKIKTSKCWSQNLHIAYSLPENVAQEQDIIIRVNGIEQTYHLTGGENELVIPVKYGKKNKIRIEAPDAAVLSDTDERELSFIIRYCYFE